MNTENEKQENTEGEASGSHKKKEDEEARFECNICLDIAKDAVVSMCGHLFCWPCLSQWFDTRPNNQVCPVCKSAIDTNKVVPIYGRGGNTTDPRKKVPPRPRGQRSEAPPQAFPGFQWAGADGVGGGNVQFSFGIGIFPLSFMASWFNNNNNNNNGEERRAETPAPGSRQYQEEEFLNNIFKYFGILMLVWLFFV